MVIGTASAKVTLLVSNRLIALLSCVVSAASAVELRVATLNVGAHYVESSSGFYYPEYGLGAAGTIDFNAVRDVLNRIDADVVALQEIDNADSEGNPNDVDALAAELGYPYKFVSPVTTSGNLARPFDTDLRVAVLSRYPFLTTDAIRSPEGAREITRFHAVVKVDVPGTARDPVIVSAHLKSGSGSDDRLRRAVEMMRLVDYLTDLGLSGADNYVVTGDYNLNPSYPSATYNSEPSGLPDTFVLGSDYSYPISYSTNPLYYFDTLPISRLDARQLDNSPSTFGTESPGGPTLDLMLVSPAIAALPYGTEVYNSDLDTSNMSGLVKAGAPLAPGASNAASDHYAVFADLELDGDYPDLALQISQGVVTEGAPDGTVTAMVSLPAIDDQPVTVMFSSSDPGSVIPAPNSIVIPAGMISGTVDLNVPRNFVEEGSKVIGITADADYYDLAEAPLQIEDIDGPYVFTSLGQTILEDFDGFSGGYDPAPWTTSFSEWQGLDDGSAVLSGWRSYGTSADGSLGFLPEGSGATATASFSNQSGVPITELEISLDAEQWRGALEGTADSINVELTIDGQTILLPDLTWNASQEIATGPIVGGTSTTLTTTISGVSIPSGTSFDLNIEFTPGPGGGAPSNDVFLNEFHYDNASSDAGEFVEIVVAPGFMGLLSDIDVNFYNGVDPANAVIYETLNLEEDFTLGGTYDGYCIFHADQPGIQNGGNDGFAIVNTTTEQVLHLVSYEGTFTAGEGLAAGMTSVSIGDVQETNSNPLGTSLGLSGPGGSYEDFEWVEFASHTKGSINSGQAFVAPAMPSQGVAVDNLSVTFLSTGDVDSDHDGQPDLYEMAFGTDPNNAAEKFTVTLQVQSGGGYALNFPGATGIEYVVESSDDLTSWEEVSTHSGSGQPIAAPVPPGAEMMFFRVAAGE